MIKHIEAILDELCPNWKELPDMVETPARVEKMYRHFFRGYSEIHDLEKHTSKVFPTTNDQMIIVKDIETFSMCPHHLLPIIYKVHIGYIPNKMAIGLSKLARIATILANVPKIQENYTTDIAETIEKALQPNGVMVVVYGVHGCMRCRGVEQDSVAITSAVHGAFKENITTRDEFLKLI